MENDIYEGTVIFFNPRSGYGFLAWEKMGIKQPDCFLHFSDIQISGFKTVKAEARVSFRIGKNNRGQDKAIEVNIL